ncbi:PTS sugar transporter subunit IIB [Fusibacter ferrireducens]|uniref:PTS sugar transporter subunit IIB n=1 Tax=Fusibacter ferrireducens TaxID=2785058 RepID=A0ABR9ZRS6_9FIRM|nr:PTS sugar transporter subunit IIB [Fusibacter ferrireducens]MBF4693162.1 PTS sugar transporter subunit IIB [Fusibacter ferrireducens]
MKKIYLFCSAGMSTHILANKMQEVADVHDLGVKVEAFPLTEIDEIYNAEPPDCILIGPQVRFIYEETKSKYKPLKTPVGLIDARDYGTINGEKVLDDAIRLIEQGVE